MGKISMPRKAISRVRNNPRRENPVDYFVDMQQPVEDEIIDIADFETFLRENLKIAGKKGNFGDDVEISSNGSKVTLSTKIIFSKKYVKYLTKKYLKKNDLRNYLHIVANRKLGYTVKYINIADGEEVD